MTVQPEASLDFETRSECDLKKAGLHRYFEHPTTEVLCLAYRIGDNAIKTWRPGQDWPLDLMRHIDNGGTVIAHNQAFDRTAWIKTFKHPISLQQSDCTMARGAAMALPQSLDQLGLALKAPVAKDRAGRALMLKMCKPRGYLEDGTAVWYETPEQLDALTAYCVRDVETERAINRIVPKLSTKEREVWILDQKINERGVYVDIPMCQLALDAVTVAKARADKRMSELTQGRVAKCTEVAKLVAWLNARGVTCESVAKGDIVEIILRTQLLDDPQAREAIELRRSAAKSSTAKFQSIVNSVCRDGRVRGSLRYHGASTGRWAGAGMQPHNFPRIDDGESVAATIKLLRNTNTGAEACDAIALFLGEPMAFLSKCLRSMIVAKPGHRLIGADYANIEGRVNAWLAGEDWKTQAFGSFDRGAGTDLYVLAYSKAFYIPIGSVTKPQRQIGKVMELSMGFQGGWRAFEKMGANYGVSVGQERGEQLKKAWRDAHPAITASWWELQNAAIEAVENPGLTIWCLNNRIAYRVAHGFLWCLLPSGRTLSYAAPRIVWSEKTETLSARPGVEFDAVNGVTKKWGTHRLYGGLQCENIVQAIARDVLVEGMMALEAAGYPLVLTIHDENISEMPIGKGSLEEFERIMSVVPAWATGLPVAVKGWEGQRYGK